VDRVSRESLDREGFASPTDDGGVAFVSAGRAVPGVEVRVVDGHGQVLKARWQGQLHFRGTSAFGGYFNNGAATADVAREDGWMDSGDFAYLADGEVFPTGRRKALILVGGRNLHAEDVEKAAGDVPGIRAGCAAAFGVADEAAGTERMVVVAESRLRGEAERLMEAVRQRVTEAVGVPPDTVVIAPPGSVPKTPSGKVRRSACRDAWQAGTLGHKRGMVRQLLGMMRERPGYWLGQAPRLLYAGWVWGCVGSAVLAIEGASFLGMAPAAAPRLSRWLLRAIGVRVRVQGALPTERPLLLVANHGSAMDPIVLMAALPTQLRFVAAEWVAQHPVVRPVLAALGGVAVRRGGEAQEPIARMQEALSQGACLVAFAEGGLERTPGLRPFMRGPFVAAARAGAALVPVALNGTRRGLQWGEWVPHRGEIVVTIGEAVAPPSDRFEAVTEVARQIRDRIAADCGEPLVQRRLVRED
jgi:1-acyl-sn-glycerol-3-phosphate acyltransferase